MINIYRQREQEKLFCNNSFDLVLTVKRRAIVTMENLIDYFDSPFKLAVNVEKLKLDHKVVKESKRESFRQNICMLVLSADMEELNDALLDIFSVFFYSGSFSQLICKIGKIGSFEFFLV